MAHASRRALRLLALPCSVALASMSSGALAGGRGGTINRSPPVIGGAPATTDVVGVAYAFTPSAYDPDGQKLSFSIANRPAWASFSKATGRLAGTPAAAGTTAPIVISVSDGYYTASLPAFTIAVVAPAPPPVVPPTISGTPPTDARVGTAYAFQPTASDPAGLPLTYTIANRPAWATFDGTTGRLSGTPASTDVGTYSNVVIGVNDGSASATLAPFTIVVQPWTAGSATLSWTPPTTRTDGSTLVDLAGFRVYYGTVPGTYSQTLTLASPAFTGAVIENLGPGTYYFAVKAFDAAGLESAFSSEASKTIE